MLRKEEIIRGKYNICWSTFIFWNCEYEKKFINISSFVELFTKLRLVVNAVVNWKRGKQESYKCNSTLFFSFKKFSCAIYSWRRREVRHFSEIVLSSERFPPWCYYHSRTLSASQKCLDLSLCFYFHLHLGQIAMRLFVIAILFFWRPIKKMKRK